MSKRSLGRSTAAAAASSLVAALFAAAPAPAAVTTFNCDASALRGTVLSAPAIEPITANRGATSCRAASGGLPNLTASLPLPLAASVLSAQTMLLGPADRPDLQQAGAIGGIADLSVKALPGLPIALPQVQLPTTLGAVAVPLPAPLPSVTVDLRPALQALATQVQALPNASLVGVHVATASASAQCTDGKPALAGTSQVAGVTLGGLDVVANGPLERTLSLDTGSIDPSNIDLSLVATPAGITTAVLQPALQLVLDSLPNIALPAALANVKITPGAQTNAAGRLTQQALRVQVSIAGQSLADLVLGEASVSSAGVLCTPAQATLSGSELLLQCTKRRLTLIDVLQRRGRVQLLGAADRKLAGKTVSIVYSATKKTVAHAKVGADGYFRTTAKLPPRSVRYTNRARYQAVLGKERSLRLKLHRRMEVLSVSSRNGNVTISGRVSLPLSRPLRAITLERRVSCKKTEVVKRFKPSRDGRFRVTVAAPTGQAAAVYRMRTTVRKTTRNPKHYPTFTLPRAVDLG
jgi:hypothetical protein